MKGYAPARWLLIPSKVGLKPLVWAALAVMLPTFVWIVLEDTVKADAFTPYFPFVVLAALFLGWKLAAAVALASSATVDALFIGPPNQLLEGGEDLIAVAAFLAGSILIITVVEAARRSVLGIRRGIREQVPEGIVFSLEEGQVWASWQGREAAIQLGSETEVAAMMEDFLAQVELGRKFAILGGGCGDGTK